MARPRLYLASRSPRRSALLQQFGLAHRVLSVQVKEELQVHESPAEFVQRLALEKASTGRASPRASLAIPVLGADTVVVIDGQILGKPSDHEESRRHLRKLSGRAHEVVTGVAMVSNHARVRLCTTRVWFRELTRDEIDRYCLSGESMGKAGSYAVQGLAALFIKRLEGSYSGVMGLPLFETGELLSEFGIDVLVRQ